MADDNDFEEQPAPPPLDLTPHIPSQRSSEPPFNCETDFLITFNEIPERLLERQKDRSAALLWIACFYGDEIRLEKLLKSPTILLDSVNDRGMDGFSVCCQKGHLKLAKMVYAFKHLGLDVNTKDDTGTVYHAHARTYLARQTQLFVLNC